MLWRRVVVCVLFSSSSFNFFQRLVNETRFSPPFPLHIDPILHTNAMETVDTVQQEKKSLPASDHQQAQCVEYALTRSRGSLLNATFLCNDYAFNCAVGSCEIVRCTPEDFGCMVSIPIPPNSCSFLLPTRAMV